MANTELSRRRFLKKSSQLSLATAAAVNSMGMLGLLGASQSLADSTDHKALVFIMLTGGNDSYNMLVPTGDNQLRRNYENHRGVVALPEADLHSLQLASPAAVYTGNDSPPTSSTEFAMHPACPAMAELFNSGELAVICNTGNLIEPTSKVQFDNGGVALPPQLFSHSDQQRQLQSEPSNPFRYGWGGRMAELLSDYNLDNNVSPLIAVGGLNSFQVTQDGLINSYSLGNSGAPSLYGYYGASQQILEASMQSIDAQAHLMAQKYRSTFDSAIKAQSIVQGAFAQAESLGVDYDGIFAAAGAVATNNSTKRLITVAKMIAGRSLTNNQRPVYFVEIPGFDNHQNLLSDHHDLMAELNAALKGFHDVLVAQGDFDQVLTLVGSEFARTFTPNGEDSEAGTDHGWGGHSMVMGGMINGGQLFGTHPDLALDQGLDTGRGRWIPTTTNSQCSAVVAHWMGIPQNQINQLFPSLENFASPFDATSNLDFIT
ncbi:MAG: DUF1501 domain-containing protein [Porticoccaceae bacterium]|nr:DUF1501 domain-containing protein [Porticoccaceae bacterium]